MPLPIQKSRVWETVSNALSKLPSSAEHVFEGDHYLECTVLLGAVETESTWHVYVYVYTWHYKSWMNLLLLLYYYYYYYYCLPFRHLQTRHCSSLPFQIYHLIPKKHYPTPVVLNLFWTVAHHDGIKIFCGTPKCPNLFSGNDLHLI
jgi:hypothetical protein